MAKLVETPLMKQYIEMKKKHPDAILLFRVGDFYETFSEDAIAASEILGITLTRRANGKASSVELAGFPHHALDTYLPKLVRAGRRVAICEQLEDPKMTKKLVKRGITELITPGVNLNTNSISPRENNFLAAIHFGKATKEGECGVAFLDITTGEFLCAQGSVSEMDKLISNISPKEILRMNGTRSRFEESITSRPAIFELDDWVFTTDAAYERLTRHFTTLTLKGFGIEDKPLAIIAAGAILHYLDITQHNDITHITALGRIDNNRFVGLDPFTQRNLELIRPAGHEGHTLLEVLDRTLTPMGARRLAQWVMFPLVDIEEIRARQDCVDQFFIDPECRTNVTETLHDMGDLERLGSALATGRIGPRSLLALGHSLRSAASLRLAIEQSDADALKKIAGEMPPTTEIVNLILRTIVPDAPALVNKGNFIASGVNAELDELRMIHSNSRQALENIRLYETERTGISSLKIGFNNVFGYYIEVRNTHRDKVPADWIRKQTLVNAERYITPELKELEEKILGAQDRISVLETELYNSILERCRADIGLIRANAHAVATVDCLLGLATAARDYRYIRPVVNDSNIIRITEGRHPVIERTLPPGTPYISNSVLLDSDNEQIMMITGPNMSGKSALLRQTALITLMAQIGSFVPADSAEIGIVDRIFTRVGASDNISSGESTFMVEMNEAAAIINNMTPRSLILFDELGRGTSTYDGISIAWAIVEHIHENGYARPKTLFATHYHELNEMEKSFKRIRNYNVSVKEINGKVIFMRKLERGGSEHSFGIHVAQLAGMPKSIVNRAEQVLKDLEEASKGSDRSGGISTKKSVSKPDVGAIGSKREGYQLSFFQLDDPLLSQIRDRLLNVSIDNLTPLQALTTLHELQGLLTGKS